MHVLPSHVPSIHTELNGVVASMPDTLRSEAPEAMLDYLANVFDETDGQTVPW
jgi:hypothetical protein